MSRRLHERRLVHHALPATAAVIVLLAAWPLDAQGIRPPTAPPNDGSKRRQVTTDAEDQSPGVFTYHNDWARTGQNLSETRLTPATVTPLHFGRLKTHLALDGMVYGQPLYAPGIVTSSGTFNLVIVATEHDTVYAFDADVDQHPAHWSTPIWQQHLVPDGAAPAPNSDNIGGTGEVCGAVAPEIGITSTPVIDPKTHTVYVVTKMKDSGGQIGFVLHALDLGTGLEQTSLGSPVVIDGSVAGNGIPDFPALNGVRFDPLRENQRAALALVNGIVYIGFASYCDQLPYYGWLFGYDTRNHLSQAVVFNTSPNGQYGGIWNSGAAPAIDSDGTMYLQVGNGPYDPKAGNWGDAILALPVDRETIIDKNAFGVLDYFEPFNPQFLLDYDLDIGTGGTLLLPDQAGPQPHLLVGGGKQGLLYVLDRDQFTTDNVHQTQCTTDALAAIASARRRAAATRTWTDTCDPVLQVFKNATAADADDRLPDVFRGHGIFSSPSYFSGRVYVAAASDQLKAFDVVEGGLANEPSSMSPMTFRFPGVTTSISANVDQGGIVWAVDSGETTGTPAVLYAFDAGDLSHVLYESSGGSNDQRAGIAPTGDADTLPVGIRFAIPTVYDSKVFVVTQGELNIFGLR